MTVSQKLVLSQYSSLPSLTPWYGQWHCHNLSKTDTTTLAAMLSTRALLPG